MVIQCPECRTRFRLADDRIKPGGIKARCSRCKHVFSFAGTSAILSEVTESPSPAPSERVEHRPPAFGARAAAGALAAAVPTSQEDEWAEQASFARAEEDPDDQPVQPPVIAEVEEEPLSISDTTEIAPEDDFASFSLEEQIPDSPPPPSEPAEEEISKLPMEEEEEEEQPLSFSTEEEEGVALPAEVESDSLFEEAEEAPLRQEEDRKDFDDLDFALQEEPPAGEFSLESAAESLDGKEPDFSFNAESKPEFSFNPQEDTPEEGGDFDWKTAEFEPPPSPAAEFSRAQLNNDEFDFGGEEPAKAPSVAEASAVPAPPPPPPLQAGEAPASRPTAGKVQAEKPPAPAKPGRSPLKGMFLFLLLLLMLLFGAAGYIFWSGGTEEIGRLIEKMSGREAAPAVVGQIRLADLQGSFVQNEEAGQLFVISGQATNEFSEARSAIALKGVLYDGTGNPLLQQTVFAGNYLKEEGLRRMSFSDIQESMNNQFGDSLSNLNVAPGKSIPFTIVFRDLPPNLSEFTVEIADSRPGSKQ